MKAKGITLYTVGFFHDNGDTTSAKKMLQSCASSSDKFYAPPTAMP